MKCYFCKQDTQIRAKFKILEIDFTSEFLPICIECLNFISEDLKENVSILEILKINEQVLRKEIKKVILNE